MTQPHRAILLPETAAHRLREAAPDEVQHLLDHTKQGAEIRERRIKRLPLMGGDRLRIPALEPQDLRATRSRAGVERSLRLRHSPGRPRPHNLASALSARTPLRRPSHTSHQPADPPRVRILRGIGMKTAASIVRQGTHRAGQSRTTLMLRLGMRAAQGDASGAKQALQAWGSRHYICSRMASRSSLPRRVHASHDDPLPATRVTSSCAAHVIAVLRRNNRPVPAVLARGERGTRPRSLIRSQRVAPLISFAATMSARAMVHPLRPSRRV